MNKKKSVSEAESAVMEVLWRSEKPLSAFDIRQQLNENNQWERTTVLTLIRRLVEKGVIVQEKKEVYYYFPVITREEYIKEETKSFVSRIYQGHSKDLITALVQDDSFTQKDIEELREFLNS